jgi:hypothetical protein
MVTVPAAATEVEAGGPLMSFPSADTEQLMTSPPAAAGFKLTMILVLAIAELTGIELGTGIATPPAAVV